jgi:hypothetical protein
VVASMPAFPFFSHRGDVEHIDRQFLVVYDNMGIVLAAGANNDLVGKNFFGEDVRKSVDHNEILNDPTRDLLSGRPGYDVCDCGEGEKINHSVSHFVAAGTIAIVVLIILLK